MYSDSQVATPTLQQELRRLAPLLGLLGLLGIGLILVSPLWQANQERERRISGLRLQLAEMQSLKEKGPSLIQEAQAAEERRRQAIARFAPPNILDRVLLDLVNTANALRNLELRSYNYRADGTQVVEDERYGKALKGRLLENTIQLEVAGDFPTTLAYLGSLERRSPRLVLSGFRTSLGESEQDRGRILTTVNATAISLITPEQAATLKKQAEAQK